MLHLTAILFFAMILAPSPAQAGLREALNTCAQRFSEIDNSAKLDPVRKLIARPGDLVLEEGKKRSASVEKALNLLTDLNPKEKAKLLIELKLAYPKLDEAPDLLRIGLNDESGWLKFFRESSSDPEKYPRMLLSARPLVEQMPESTRLKILKEVAARYPSAKKMAPGSTPGFLWPKRLLDGWLRVLLRGDETFRDALAEGKKPLAAYQSYLDQMNREVLKHMPDGGAAYGKLSAEDIHGLAKRIQEYLKEPGAKKFIDNVMDDGEVLEPRVRLFGSTIKGLSKTGSDLDLGTEFIRHEFVEGLPGSPGLAATLEKFMEKEHPKVKLNFRDKPHTIHQIDSILTPLEPFMVEITPDRIELLVYSRDIQVNLSAPTAHRAFLRTHAPDRYNLDAP